MAAGRVDVVREALVHLPACESTSADIYLIEAWLAKNQGDRVDERHALDRLVAAHPSNLTALKWLAELARHDGHAERSAEIEHRKAEIDLLNSRYRKLFDRNQPIRDAAEMGQLADRLGRPFEARVFLSVAAAASLNRDVANRSLESLRRHSSPVAQTTGTLADVIAAQRSDGANGGD
jgi:hypothetical protein